MTEYNMDIISIAGIPDLGIIFETVKLQHQHRNVTEVRSVVVDENRFGFDIKDSAARFFAAMRNFFLSAETRAEEDLFLKLVACDDMPTAIKKGAIYIQACRNNALFYDISLDYLYPRYLQNRQPVSSRDLRNYLYANASGTAIETWSENTVNTVASKYLSFLRRLGYLEAGEGHTYEFRFSIPRMKMVAYMIYLLKYAGYSDQKAFDSSLFEALMLDEQRKVRAVKKASSAGFFGLSLTGNLRATFDLRYGQEEVLNELAR